ncbi:hypothetical protein ACT80S_04355 [Ramlibacter sp. MAHUQ-53]|uniref:hypothetical protein n=1 Tax=unclassified Ramlibacter TaxID=2617605 RepID=UPI0036362DE0
MAHPSIDNRSYRLKRWPDLPDGLRIAPIYRILSTMTVKPVSRRWIRDHSPLTDRDVDALLAVLGSAVVETQLPTLTQALGGSNTSLRPALAW